MTNKCFLGIPDPKNDEKCEVFLVVMAGILGVLGTLGGLNDVLSLLGLCQDVPSRASIIVLNNALHGKAIGPWCVCFFHGKVDMSAEGLEEKKAPY